MDVDELDKRDVDLSDNESLWSEEDSHDAGDDELNNRFNESSIGFESSVQGG